MTKHPIQPVEIDQKGTARFKANAIVRFLLDTGRADLNMLALIPFSQDDRQQFAQLIGYSIDGYSELSYHDPSVLEAADAMTEALRSSNEPT